MSSDNSSYESAPLPPESEVETLTNGPTKEGETNQTTIQEESSNPNPNPNQDPPKRRGRKKKEVPIEAPPNYLFKFQEEEKLIEPDQAETDLFKYKVNDLVWGKVKSHPWWPGQIYDPSLASEAALKIKKKDHFLIAYFGDKTFAWNEASALKPYQTMFPNMEKQSSTETFVAAVDSSLAEASRRVELALVCKCSDGKILKERLVDNAGIIDGTHVPDVDNLVILGSFDVERLMEFIQELAVFGKSIKVSKLEFVMARAYLKSFDKFRGFPDASEFAYGEEFGNDPDKVSELEKSGTGRKRKKKDEKKQESEATPKKKVTPKGKKRVRVETNDSDYDPQSDSDEMPKRRGSSRNAKWVKMTDDEYDPSSGTDEMPKKRGRSKKMKQVEISDEEFEPVSKARSPSSKLKTPTKADTSTPRKRGRPKKTKALEEFDLPPKTRTPSSKLKTPTKTDTGTSRKRGRPKKTKGLEISDDPQSKALSSLSKPNSPTKSDTGTLRKRGRPRKVVEDSSVPVEHPSATEMLSQLCVTAQNPVKSSSFTPSMHSFFTEYKHSLAPDNIDEKDLIEETGAATKSGRRVSKPKHIQDSYWTDVILDTGSDKDEEPGFTSGEKKKRGPYKKREKNNGKNSEADVGPAEEKNSVSNNICEENSDGSNPKPTGFVLYFNNPDAIPTEKEFNDIFAQYGPIREADTEINKQQLRATVFFEKRADAEVAFSSPGKYSKFGPALVSYELKDSPALPKVVTSDADVAGKGDALTGDGRNLVGNSEASTKDGTNLNVSPDEKGKEPAEAPMQVDKRVEPSA